MAIVIQVQLSPGCGHGASTLALVSEVAASLAPGATVETLTVVTAEDADRHGFRGSPSVLVNGRDLGAAPLPGVGLGWRLYGLAGVPSRQLIEAALRAALE